MATLIDCDKVNYMCSCKRVKPLAYLYYCKYCKPFTLKCKECVFHEIDQKYFCPNCFDNKVQKEVIQLKYKCSNCYSCPCCKNLLMIRASTVKTKDGSSSNASTPQSTGSSVSLQTTPTDPQISTSTTPVQTSSQLALPGQQQQAPQVQKVFYLMCGFCRWTTRDVGIPDATSTPGGWKVLENPNQERIQELCEAYKTIAAREKFEKDRKKYSTLKNRRFHMSPSGATLNTAISSVSSTPLLHSDKYGILSPAHKRMQSAGANTGQNTMDTQTPIDQMLKTLVRPGLTVDSFEPLSDDFYLKEANINSITSISQRHANPDFQPAKSSDLYPLNKFYLSKESKRCTGCEHNVLKPESNITSIKFKLHQMALFVVPEVRIVTIPEWKLNEPNEVILSVTNRCEFDLNVSFSSVAERSQEKNQSGFETNARVSFGKHEAHEVKVDHQDNAKPQQASLTPSDLDAFKGFVCFRRDNKIAIVCQVTLDELDAEAKTKAHVKCAFELKYSNASPENTQSFNTSTPVVTSPPTAMPPQTIVQKIFLDFGPVKGAKVISKPKYIDDCLNQVTSKK